VPMSYRIVLDKENFKFSASHFTIFGPNSAERLHGHNYYVLVEIELTSLEPTLGLAMDFNLIKPLVREITTSLDEYVLIPERSPFVTIDRTSESISVKFAQKTYQFPTEDVKFLPASNITSEELSRSIAEQLSQLIHSRAPEALARIRSLSVGVQETRGQMVIYQLQDLNQHLKNLSGRTNEPEN
jgi:6-pyruvoyltetrahydropterin/6-carboxytetrahydropterin synthase